MFIDVYTDWCGWCKRMDASTFKDPTVAAYLNANFYPVKLNAETRDTITFNGKTYTNSQSVKAKQMIADWETDFPNRNAIMMNALQNVYPSHLLDKNLYDFKNLESKISE